MNDEPPTKPETPESTRPRATSSADWIAAAAGEHTLDSSPPGVQRVYALIGFYATWLVRETWLHRKLILHWIVLISGAGALIQHVWHLVK